MDTKTIMIIVAVVLVLISSSVGAYFMMSGGSEDSSSSTPSSSSSSTSTPPATPPATPSPPPPPTVNWAGNSFTSDGRCGPSFGNKACGGKQCCSKFGWCGGQKGQNDDWCSIHKGFDGRFDGEKP